MELLGNVRQCSTRKVSASVLVVTCVVKCDVTAVVQHNGEQNLKREFKVRRGSIPQDVKAGSVELKPAADCSTIWLHLSGKIKALMATALSSSLSSFSSQSPCVTLRLSKTSTHLVDALFFFFLSKKHHVDVLVATQIALYYCDMKTVVHAKGYNKCVCACAYVRVSEENSKGVCVKTSTGFWERVARNNAKHSADTIAAHI